MHVTPSTLEHVLIIAATGFVLVESLLAAFHTHAAERAGESVPERFERKLSDAAHLKAAQFTSELTQANLIRVYLSAFFAILMTFGGGLTLLASFASSLTQRPAVAEWLLLAFVTALLAFIDFPFHWYENFRVRERYGYMREERSAWIAKNAKATFAGWLIELPLIALLLALFESAGDDWWIAAWAVWIAWLLWRWKFTAMKGLFWGRRTKRIDDPELRRLVAELLADQGFEMLDLCIMTKPASWKHSHVVLAGFGRERRVVVFAHAASKLNRREILGLIAHDIGHLKHFHAWVRIFVYAAAGWLVCRFAGWGSEHSAFFEGFGLSPWVSYYLDGSHAGFVAAVAIVAFPVLFYPLQPIVNGFARAMQYDADTYAAKLVGADAVMEALVKLHRDYATTLTPSRLYSLFHYSRPHAGMRVARLLSLVESGRVPLHISKEGEKTAAEQSEFTTLRGINYPWPS